MHATARAHSNMALIKYWGKRHDTLVLPHTGSVSMTLDALHTTTTVTFSGQSGDDSLLLDDAPASPGEVRRVAMLLDLVRARAAEQEKHTGTVRPPLGAAAVVSHNNFPTAGGLASSASGFAALTAAAAWAAGLELDAAELSILARRASGSACRSVAGGFVEWVRGIRDDGADSVGVSLLPPHAWDVAMVVALVDTGRKSIGSRDAMKDSVLSSPYYPAWVQTTLADIETCRTAIAQRDLEAVGRLAERSMLRMHACALASDPPALFWKPPTLALIDTVAGLRRSGIGAWATIDAGPHVAAWCAGPDAPRVAEALRTVGGVKDVIVCRPGGPVSRLGGDDAEFQRPR